MWTKIAVAVALVLAVGCLDPEAGITTESKDASSILVYIPGEKVYMLDSERDMSTTWSPKQDVIFSTLKVERWITVRFNLIVLNSHSEFLCQDVSKLVVANKFQKISFRSTEKPSSSGVDVLHEVLVDGVTTLSCTERIPLEEHGN